MYNKTLIISFWWVSSQFNNSSCTVSIIKLHRNVHKIYIPLLNYIMHKIIAEDYTTADSIIVK
jgi:hypothetical protein